MIVRRASLAWLRSKGWGVRNLHDAVVALGLALPGRLTPMSYVTLLRSACADPDIMKQPGGSFPVPALKATLASLGLGMTGRKAQLVERLVNALREVGAPPGEPPADDGGCDGEELQVETDIANTSKVRAFAARADAAWQEHSSDGAQVLLDALEDFVDGEEADVRAEQEALLQLNAGVNPPDVLLESACPAGLARISQQDAAGVIARSAASMHASAQAAGQQERRADRLDPTQRCVHDRVLQWAQAGATDPLRVLLLGTAGTGKSEVVKAIVASLESCLGTGSVIRCAHTGVAAFNMGAGAETINSVFNLGSAMADTASIDALVDKLALARLLIIDEISMVGSEKFFQVSDRLDLVTRVLRERRRRAAGASNGDGAPQAHGFGALGVLLVGDFGQVPPIGDASLLLSAKGQSRRAAAGQRLFRSFTDVVRLRRIYRQKGPSPYKDSTLRLRDGAMTLHDYSLWCGHDVSAVPHDRPLRRALETDALWLTTENKKVGERNGAKLARHSEANGAPVFAFDAVHSDPRAEKRPPDEFYQLRTKVHLSVGAPVLLTSNLLWELRVVRFGLMNGARGRVVGIVMDAAPPALPAYVVVDFPEYCGAPFWPEHPTWVPVPPIRRQSKKARSLERVQLPLRLSWSLTVHKAQGLTCPSGVCLDLSTSGPRSAAASPGPRARADRKSHHRRCLSSDASDGEVLGGPLGADTVQ
ncbi:unnamed protein product [Prorocentrum cordatum]|uniref:ATP-dependent DNA helicase n=1 Tax=Prorocentrum cordatum TaxID=2364126 RepID=A0ABN9VZT9_9DINO|nr:unnamed protein product [Polarella glacialis]